MKNLIIGGIVGSLAMFVAFAYSLGQGTEIKGTNGTYLCFRTE